METIEAIEPKSIAQNELTTILAHSGLVETKQQSIVNTLGMFFTEATKWNETIQTIEITDPTETGKMKMAKEGRLFLRKKRLEASSLVKIKREEVKTRMADDVLEDKLWLKAGQMMEATFGNLETKLEEKELFAERWEENRKKKLEMDRRQEIQGLNEFIPINLNLGLLSETDYTNLVNGAKMQSKAKQDAAAKEQAELLAKQKEEAEERERVRLENIRLKEDADRKEAEHKAEVAKQKAEHEKKMQELESQRKEADAKQLKEQQKKDAENKLAREKLLAEQVEKDKILAEERRQAEIKFHQEKLAREKIEEELNQKKEAEAKKQQAILAEAKKAKAAPDKVKLAAFSKNLTEIEYPELMTEEGKKIIEDVKGLMAKVTAFINTKTTAI